MSTFTTLSLSFLSEKVSLRRCDRPGSDPEERETPPDTSEIGTGP